ncbi:cell wall-binding repeat-containing protein [Candidatus Poriferisodalis sp.]|uniref:cell wall-binding repeat-containing protein n=1 Tax=Candidatus Poriferisodalis sp. TaxID=3101277 RepID=UPI003B02D068
MRRVLWIVVVVTAAAWTLPSCATAGAAESPADVAIERYGGSDRYATSLLIAEAVAAEAGGTLDQVVLVSGRNWTDAVVAAPLAGHLGAAVLATPPGELRADAAAFLERTGVSTVQLIGANSDTDGVGPTVISGLNRLGITTVRTSHSDQYTTAALVAAVIGTPGDMGSLGSTAVVASGEVFADALVAGAFAARGKHPVLLTPDDELHDSAAEYLRDLQVDHVVLMGGTAALSRGVEVSIRALGIEVTRLAGTTRYDTAVKAAELTTGRYSSDCFSTRRAGLARARVPFDSFSAGPLLARLCAPLLLADPKAIPDDTAAYLDGVRRSVQDGDVRVTVFGGEAAVSQAAIEAYLTRNGASAPEQSEDVANRCGGNATDPPRAVIAGRTSIARDPAWSPDCRQIAFSSGGSVYVADRDGSNPRSVFGIPTVSAVEPDWSPDGTMIALVASRYESSAGHFFRRSHIFTVGSDGTGMTQLTSGAVEDYGPSWSPDGRELVFGRQIWTEESAEGRRGQQWFIASIDADGENLSEITRGPYSETNPSWSPDGSRIAVEWNGRLAVMNPDGTDVEPLPVDYELNSWSGPSWSPDGTQLAFSVFEERDGIPISGESNIAVFDFRTKQVREITDLEGDEINPDWSPDGQLILFNTFEMGYAYSRIFVTGAGGT